MSSNDPPMKPPTATAAAASSIDQLTMSYLRGEISFQDYETMIENQHFLAIAASTQQQPRSMIVLSTVELPSTSIDLATASTEDAPGAGSDLDRFFSLKDILGEYDLKSLSRRYGLDLRHRLDDDDEDELDGEPSEPEYDIPSTSGSSKPALKSSLSKRATRVDVDDDDTTLSQWNDFDIETLNFDKFIQDHQTEGKSTKTPPKSNKRKRASDSATKDTGVTATSDPSELRAKRRV